MTNSLAPTNWFQILDIQFQNKIGSILTSRTVFAFLLDGGAIFCVLIAPKWKITTQNIVV